jgi:hypothetical protein
MALSKLMKRFSTDEDREENGRWVDFGEGLRIKVRRVKSKKSMEIRKDLERPFVDQIRRGPLPDAVAEEMLVNQIARGIIADWEGVELEDGVLLPYTAKNAYDVLKALPELRDSVLQISIDAENYRLRTDEDAEKNS